MSTGDLPSGLGGGPAGCGSGCVVLFAVALLILLFVAGVVWMLRDVGAL